MYYVLLIDSLINTFSILETAKEIKFEYCFADQSNTFFDSIRAGDTIFGYYDQPKNSINTIFKVVSVSGKTITLSKNNEVLYGFKDLSYEMIDRLREYHLFSITDDLADCILDSFYHDKDENNIMGNNDFINYTDKYNTGILKGEKRNRIFFGAPGTGKSFTLNDEKDILIADGGTCERVTFHPDYTYANFVGTYKPVPSKNNGISYEYVPGPFMRVYVEALKDARDNEGNANPHILVIEEINRANVAAVFGEVFQLLDRKDNVSEYPIQPSEDIKAFLAGPKGLNAGTPDDYDEIKIPDNMFIWASMNSADQGVFPMDTAFKRRWNFTYIGINNSEEELEEIYLPLNNDGKTEYATWNSIRQAINNWMAEQGINEDKQLGAFFISKEIINDRNGIEKIIDSLKSKVIMYLFEGAAKSKRPRLFAEEIKYNRYSLICEDFDRIGVHVFNQEIVNKIELFAKDEIEEIPQSSDKDGTTSFTFLSEDYNVKKNIGVLRCVLTKLSETHLDELKSIADEGFRYTTSGKVFLATDKSKFNSAGKPEEISNTGIYFDSKLASAYIYKFIEKIINACGLNYNEVFSIQK